MFCTIIIIRPCKFYVNLWFSQFFFSYQFYNVPTFLKGVFLYYIHVQSVCTVETTFIATGHFLARFFLQDFALMRCYNLFVSIVSYRMQAAGLNVAPPGGRKSSNRKMAPHRRAKIRHPPHLKTPPHRGRRVKGQMQLRNLRVRGQRRRMGRESGHIPVDIRNKWQLKSQVGNRLSFRFILERAFSYFPVDTTCLIWFFRPPKTSVRLIFHCALSADDWFFF